MIDSPGGEVVGLEEVATEIQRTRASKLVVAAIDGTAASAAYWIASQADLVMATPSAELGSIGVLAVHTDASGLYDKVGVRTTLVVSAQSPFKAELSDTAALSTDARQYLQHRVDASAARFVTAVAIGRRVSESTVRARFGQGRMVDSREAVERGMADTIGPFDEALRVAGQRAAGRPSPERAYMDTQLTLAYARQHQAGLGTPRSREADRTHREMRLRLARQRMATRR
jgi:signal peptide peptidase SppA